MKNPFESIMLEGTDCTGFSTCTCTLLKKAISDIKALKRDGDIQTSRRAFLQSIMYDFITRRQMLEISDTMQDDNKMYDDMLANLEELANRMSDYPEASDNMPLMILLDKLQGIRVVAAGGSILEYATTMLVGDYNNTTILKALHTINPGASFNTVTGQGALMNIMFEQVKLASLQGWCDMVYKINDGPWVEFERIEDNVASLKHTIGEGSYLFIRKKQLG